MQFSTACEDRVGRRDLLARAGLGLAGALALRPAWAQGGSYPSGPIRIILGFPPGGGTDIIARAVARGLSDQMKVSFYVENRPGAAGNIGAAVAARAKPDGYTLLAITVPHVVNASLYRSLSYDPIKDFAPVADVASVPMVLTVAQDSPLKDVQGLLAAARAAPGQLTFSSGGTGSLEHLCGAVLGQTAKVDVTHIPYKGAGESLKDLISQRVSFAFNTMPSVLSFVQSKTLRPLAVTTSKRASLLADVPTMIEAGVPDFVLASWYGIVAPKGTPARAVEMLNAATAQVLQTPTMRTVLAQLGAEVESGSPEAFGAFLSAEAARFRTIVDGLDLHVD